MGIKGMSQLLKKVAPSGVKECKISSFHGSLILAYEVIFKFMIAIRSGGDNLKDESGSVTSHLSGLFFRTIKLVENGIKPIYVYDGAPPEDKDELISKREKNAEINKERLTKAIEEEDTEKVEKYAKRSVRLTVELVQESKMLLELMGIPFVEAKSEAEAQCAYMVKMGIAYAAATEDMDALTFGAEILLRNINLPIIQYELKEILKELKLDYNQFIDLCILMGCDYCSTIRGVGPHKALELIHKFNNIDNILKEKKNLQFDQEHDFASIRKLFSDPEVLDLSKTKFEWKQPKTEELIKLMVESKGFNKNTVLNGIERLAKALKKPPTGTKTKGTIRKSAEKPAEKIRKRKK